MIAEVKRIAAIEAEERHREIAEAKAISERVVSRSSANTAPKPKAKAKAQTQASAMTFEASAYVADCYGCSGITASGIDVRNSIYSGGYRIIAVDPGVIALGSIVSVTLANGESFEAIAADTGGLVKGKRIDILYDNLNEAKLFGRREVYLKIVN